MYHDFEPQHVLELVDVDNIALDLGEETLTTIGNNVVRDYESDKASMKDWLERNELAMKLIDMKPEYKTDPWPGAANTKLPLVLNAALKASAEEYAEILRTEDVVKTKILGPNTDAKRSRASRVETRMNHQFAYELEDWYEDHDKLILSKNILGTVHKKYFYSDKKIQCALRRTGVVINDNVDSLKDAPRVTDELERFWWQAEEKFRSKEWKEIDLSAVDDTDFAEDDKLNLFLEQIRREDLDQDGYPEPYIVTVHVKTKQVVRICANYTPESIVFDLDIDVLEYANLSDADKAKARSKLDVIRIDTTKSRVRYIKYDMIPTWQGGYWGFGFGILLGPLNENCNQLINHLLNSGHLANNGGGFINSSIKMGSGELSFRQNEWKKVQSPGMDITRNIMPLPVREPSQTLYALLGTLMDVLRELSAVSEVMSGDQPKANMAAASIDMLIEQGRKMFNSVYKRHFRALSAEQNALFDLNFLYQDPNVYGELLDFEAQEVPKDKWMEIARADFTREGIDIRPTANPEFSSKVRRMAEARALMELREDPNVDGVRVTRMYVEAIVDDPQVAALLVPEQPVMTPGQQMQQVQMKVQEFLASNEARTSEAKAKLAEVQLQIAMIDAGMKSERTPMDLERAALGVEKQKISVINEAQKGQMSMAKGSMDMEKGHIDVTKGRMEMAKSAMEMMQPPEETNEQTQTE